MSQFAKLIFHFAIDGIDYRKASSFQGILMEHISRTYGDKLHAPKQHPYSQYLIRTPTQLIWTICTLNSRALEEIISPLSKQKEFYLRSMNTPLIVQEKSLQKLSKEKLLEYFYGVAAERKLSISFLTPTAFCQQSRYCIMPDISLIIQSLMMKYQAVTNDGEVAEIDIDTLDDIVKNTFIVRHRIRSLLFPFERTKIPGFIGDVSLKTVGTETMARYLRLLSTFGEFSGIGLKNAMGMGAISYLPAATEDNKPSIQS